MKAFIFLYIGLFTMSISAQNPKEVLNNLPPDLQQQLKDQAKTKGAMTFKVLPSKSTIGVELTNVPSNVPMVFQDAFKSGSVLIYDINYDVDICPNSGGSPDFTYWILHIDENSFYGNTFMTNQENKTAAIDIRGRMDKYKPAADFCSSKNIIKVASGSGGMSVDFKTFMHIAPRKFQVWEGQTESTQNMLSPKELRDFFRKHLNDYYKYIASYKGNPHTPNFIGNDDGSIDPGGHVVPSGNEESGNWKAIRDGLVSLKNAVDVFSIAKDITDFALSGVKLFGPAKQYNTDYIGDATDFMSSALSINSLDPSSIAEGVIYENVNNMVAAFAEHNKNYAKKGNANAQQIMKKAKVPINNPSIYKEAINADLMAYELNNMFDQLDKIDEQIEAMNIPERVAVGRVWGPDLWQAVQSYALPNNPASFVGSSVNPSDTSMGMDPKILEAMQNAGYEIPNIDVNAMIKQAQDKIPDGVNIDLSAPLFIGQLYGTKIHTFEDGKTQWPRMMLNFSISSPKIAIDNDWLDADTIFDDIESENQDDDNPKPKIYYISTTGNDSNPGTNVAPFASMQKALDIAQIDRLGHKRVTIIVKNGMYKQTAKIDLGTITSLPELTITAEEKYGAVFTSSEKVANDIEWTQNGSVWEAPKPLHAQELQFTPNTSPFTHPVPVISVNGKRLMHIPLDDVAAPNLYSLLGDSVKINPPTEVSNLNIADVQISTRAFAIKFKGSGKVVIRDLKLINYPMPNATNSPGIEHGGQVIIMGCKFE
jgi:hypothetical protein